MRMAELDVELRHSLFGFGLLHSAIGGGGGPSGLKLLLARAFELMQAQS